MYLANKLQAKTNSYGMKLVPERKVKNKAKFVQIIQQNFGSGAKICIFLENIYRFLMESILMQPFRIVDE